MRHTLLLTALLLFVIAIQAKALDDSEVLAIAQEAAAKALTLKNNGQYDKAEKVYREALDKLQGNNDNSNYRKLKLNYCELFLRRGMYQTANDTLETFSAGDKESSQWNRLKANTLTYLGKYDEALEIYDMFICYDINISPSDRWNIYSSIGYIYNQIGQYDLAIENMRKAIDMLQSQTTVNQANVFTIRSNMSIAEARAGQFAQAIEDIDASLQYFRSNEPIYAITLRKKAEILLMQGNIADATTAFIEYTESERRQAIRQFALFTEQKRLDYWKNKRPLISEIFQTETERPDALFDVSIFRREVSLLGSADSVDIPKRLKIRGNDIRRALRKGEIAIDFVKYTKDTVDLYAAIVAFPDKDQRGVKFIPLWTESQLNDYPIGRTTLKSAVCSRLTADKNAVYTDSTLSRTIWQPLMPYLSNASDVYFCPDGLLNMLAIENLPFDGQKPTFHRMTTFTQLTKRGAKRRTTDKMLVVGGLDYNAYLAPDTIAQANHEAIDLLHQKIGVGRIFTYLGGTKDEVSAINKSVKHRIALDTAIVKSEAELKRDLTDKKYSAIHLSTHGYSLSIDVAEQAEMFRDSLTEDRSLVASGIALSGANVAYKSSHSDDGVLSARELCDMNLKHIDLVVLSACQTALGNVSDEGPAGLVRGLKKSGANTIIATLWEVDDAATRLLMTYFYETMSLHPELSTQQALTAAQDSLRSHKVVAHSYFNPATLASTTEYVDYQNDKQTPITPYESPYYWAPFVAIDDRIK